jgi:hypothetical protein
MKIEIPSRITDSDEWYDDLCEYVAKNTGWTHRDDLYDGDGAYGDAYFEDEDGDIWHGVLDGASGDYILEMQEKEGA